MNITNITLPTVGGLSKEKIYEWCYNQHYNLEVSQFNANIYCLIAIMLSIIGIHLVHLYANDKWEGKTPFMILLIAINLFSAFYLVYSNFLQ